MHAVGDVLSEPLHMVRLSIFGGYFSLYNKIWQTFKKSKGVTEVAYKIATRFYYNREK